MSDKAPIDEAMARRGRRPSRPPPQPDIRRVEVPIDHNPGTVVGDGASAQSARAAMTALHDAWLKIRDAAHDETVKLPRLATAAQGAMERALTAADKATEAISGNVRRLESEIVAATQPRQDATLAAEIRAYWRQTGWTNGLVQATREDARTASAILSAPAYLSGLDDKQRGVIHDAAVQAHAAEPKAALDEAVAAQTKVERAATRMIALVAPRIRVWAEPDNTDLTALEEYGRG